MIKSRRHGRALGMVGVAYSNDSHFFGAVALPGRAPDVHNLRRAFADKSDNLPAISLAKVSYLMVH